MELWEQSSSYGSLNHSLFTKTEYFRMCKIHFKLLVAHVFAMAFTSVQPIHYCRFEVKIIFFSLCAQNREHQNITQHIAAQVQQMKDIFLCLYISQLLIRHITKININPHSHKHTKTTQLTKVFRQQYTFFSRWGCRMLWRLLQCVVWDLLTYAVQTSISKQSPSDFMLNLCLTGSN